MVVVEAAARGTPSVVLAGADNAATELIEEGVNGTIATGGVDSLAAAILRVQEAGMAMRESTAAWFAANSERLSLTHSLEQVLASYGAPSARS